MSTSKLCNCNRQDLRDELREPVNLLAYLVHFTVQFWELVTSQDTARPFSSEIGSVWRTAPPVHDNFEW